MCSNPAMIVHVWGRFCLAAWDLLRRDTSGDVPLVLANVAYTDGFGYMLQPRAAQLHVT